MAYLICRKAEHANEAVFNYEGDIIGVIDDDKYNNHPCPLFLARWDFVWVNGIAADYNAKMHEYTPVRAKCFLEVGQTEYVWDLDEVLGESGEEYKARIADILQVWSTNNANIADNKPPIRWYHHVSKYGHFWSLNELTPEELAFLTDPSFDINFPANESYIRKMIRDWANLPGNDVEVVELRNSRPPHWV